MAEKADDLYLPNMVLLRILRDTLPERTLVSREARSAISKVASSFILYVTSLASARCEAAKRKTLLASDIMGALQEMQFGHYTDQLNEFVQRYLDQLSQKRKEKRLASTIQSTSETQPETESMTEDGDAVPSESNPDSPTATASEAEVMETFVHETTVDAGESSKADS